MKYIVRAFPSSYTISENIPLESYIAYSVAIKNINNYSSSLVCSISQYLTRNPIFTILVGKLFHCCVVRGTKELL